MQYLSEVIYYKKLGFESYPDYLKSPQWKEKRQEYKDAGLPFFCMFCQKPTPILHHVDYSKLGKEDVRKDIVPVCTDHHRLAHYKDGQRLQLLPNILKGRVLELYHKNDPWYKKLGDVRLGTIVNNITHWLWYNFSID